jgi:hypothetical protein
MMKINIHFAGARGGGGKVLASEPSHAENPPASSPGDSSDGYWEEAKAVSEGLIDSENARMLRSTTTY